MALMSSIRKNLAQMFAVLAFLFIIMIVFEWGMDLTGRSGGFLGRHQDELGTVNGTTISYKQFSDLVRRATENQKSQTGQEVDEDTERMIRSQVWNQMVDDVLLNEEIRRLGITVTDQEIRDIVQGPNPPEFLISQFKDSTGTFRRDAYDQAMLNPQNKAAWVQVEDVLREQQKRQKLQSILLSSVQASEGEVLQRFIDRNVTLDADFALFDVNRLAPDSSVTITDRDIQEAYEQHPEEFKTRATRKLKYVLFSLAATREDSAAVEGELNHVLEQAKNGMDFGELAKTYSETPQSDAYFQHGEMSRVKERAVFGAKKGDVVGPIADVDGLSVIKVLDERTGTKEFVNAAHILLRHVNGPDSVKVISRIKDLARRARAGENFAELARQNSEDGSASDGGDLGWNSKGGWVKPFEEAAFGARPGSIVGPVRTQFGWHVIKVLGRDKREVKVASVTMKIKASPQTTDAAYRNAEDFSFLAGKEGFEKATEISNMTPRETPEFTKEGFIPGLGQNDLISAFAFNGSKDDVSKPMTVSNGVVVLKISGVREEGLRPLDDVRVTARALAARAKRMAKVGALAAEFARTLSPGADLLAAARTNPQIIAQNTGPFKPTDFPQGVGREPRFIGTALALQPGAISAPFEGNRGYFMMKLLSRTPVDTVKLAAERSTLKQQILQEKRNRFLTDWQRTLRESATIVDRRDQFYR